MHMQHYREGNCQSIEVGVYSSTHLHLLSHTYLCTGTTYEAQTNAILLILRWAF